MRRRALSCALLAAFLTGAAVPPSPATLTVSNINDSGVGSLRQAILDSNASVGVVDTISFNFVLPATFQEIVLLSALPDITDPVIIDGQSSSAEILINGAAVPAPNAVLTVSAGGTTIRDLGIMDGNDAGIRLQTNGGNLIQSCRIGSERRNPPYRPNAGPGIDVVSGISNNIDANFIVGNGGSAIVVRSAATSVRYLNNIMFHNGGLSIDLGGDGRTPNDPGDGDTGANNLQNFPVLDGFNVQKATSKSRNIMVFGSLDAAPSTSYRLFALFGRRGKIAGDMEMVEPSYFDIGSVTTDATGHAFFNQTVPNVSDEVTAASMLARDPANNMSEISPPIDIPAISLDSGCGACGLECLVVLALAAVIRRPRR